MLTLDLDLDTAGHQLVADIENYLRTLPQQSRLNVRQLLAQAAALPPRNPHGQHRQPWHAPHTLPTPSLRDRLNGRQPPADITVQQHLTLMSAYIQHHGWTQGQLWNHDGAVCLLGAQLRVLTAGYGTTWTAVRARQRIGNTLGRLGAGMPIDTWNDQPGRTTADIHHLLRAAAAA